MDLKEVYQQRIKKFSEREAFYTGRMGKFQLLRLGVFFAALVVFYMTFNIHDAFPIGIVLIFLIIFFLVTRLDAKNTANRVHFGILKKINEDECRSLQGDFKIYKEGNQYIDATHPYSSDLDIFGKSSLFQFINRTTSAIGSDLLAETLKAPAAVEEIHLRQAAVSELTPMIDWRQEFQASGQEFKDNPGERESILNWLNEPAFFLNKKGLTAFTIFFPFITVSLVFASFWELPGGYAFLAILIQGLIIYINRRKVEESYKDISQKVELLKLYSTLIAAIESGNFKSEKLASIKNYFILENVNASKHLKELSKIVNYLDFRLNIYFWTPLNLLTFWDIHWIREMEKWKEANKEKVLHWFNSLAEFEVLSSFANLYFNHPGWAFPEIIETGFIIDAKEAGHPLINPKQRVTNNIQIKGKAKIMLVTGSNMAGKSTYLRTVGVNMVLAMSGAPVCARSFVLSPVKPYTSMRITDSLEENASSFYAELKRLRDIIIAVKKGEQIFFLMDEILRGTNSNDRHIGSKALIKQMIKHNGTGIIATHDLELGKLENELPGNIENFSFDVQIENDKLFFDYKLHKGICKSLNASVLMKKMGIEIE